MNIPDEVLEKSTITIYNDSDKEVIKDIEDYNKKMSDCRIKMKQVEETKFAFSILNPLTVCGMIAGDAGSVFSNPVLAICLLAAYSILFVVFTLFKDNLFVSTIATSLLLLLDLKFAILLVADIVILIIHNSIEKPLKSTNGYPVFIDITVKYERFNKPKYINTDQYPHPENPNL